MHAFTRAIVLTGALTLAPVIASAQEKIEMKLAYFVGDQHPMSQWLIRWAETLEKRSNGRLVVKRFPGAQMGPTPQHYDFARTGQADVSWFLHGGTPGRFPLTDLSNLPFLIGSAEIGTKVMNDRDLRTRFLDAEHKGVRVLLLFTHQPGQIHTTKKPVTALADLKGMRIRFPIPMVRDFLTAIGATPVGVTPTELLEQLQKGTIDGAMQDYGGAGIAFKLGGTVRHTTEIYAYVTSFGLAMNPDFYNRLPADLKKLVDETTTGVASEVGRAWDAIDGPGKKALADGGMAVHKLNADDWARVKKIAAEFHEKEIKELEAKNLPGRAVYNLMKQLAEKHAKNSNNFLQ